jgi:hypothetical protein
MMTNPNPRNAALDAQLQIDHIQSCDDVAGLVAVRCIRGPVRLRARFHRIQDTPASIDLELTRILFYGHLVDTLDPGHTALVRLQGTGIHHLEPKTDDPAFCWPVIQGINPPS